jgi:hypothetical protein
VFGAVWSVMGIRVPEMKKIMLQAWRLSAHVSNIYEDRNYLKYLTAVIFEHVTNSETYDKFWLASLAISIDQIKSGWAF